MWLACHTQEEIAKAVGCPQQTIADILPKMENFRFPVKPGQFSEIPNSLRGSFIRIDKDLKAELRQTAFDMWMACHSHDEIAEAVGFSKRAIGELLISIQSGKNGTDSENAQSSENPEIKKAEVGLVYDGKRKAPLRSRAFLNFSLFSNKTPNSIGGNIIISDQTHDDAG